MRGRRRFVRAKTRIDRQIPDPKHMEPEKFRKVRDFISAQVERPLKVL